MNFILLYSFAKLILLKKSTFANLFPANHCMPIPHSQTSLELMIGPMAIMKSHIP